jgi:hypothetical protein
MPEAGRDAMPMLPPDIAALDARIATFRPRFFPEHDDPRPARQLALLMARRYTPRDTFEFDAARHFCGWRGLAELRGLATTYGFLTGERTFVIYGAHVLTPRRQQALARYISLGPPLRFIVTGREDGLVPELRELFD